MPCAGAKPNDASIAVAMGTCFLLMLGGLPSPLAVCELQLIGKAARRAKIEIARCCILKKLLVFQSRARYIVLYIENSLDFQYRDMLGRAWFGWKSLRC